MTALAVALAFAAVLAWDAFRRHLAAQQTREQHLAAAALTAVKACDKARDDALALVPRIAALEARAEREDLAANFSGVRR